VLGYLICELRALSQGWNIRELLAREEPGAPDEVTTVIAVSWGK
jgi:hypothetical protein